MATTTQLLDYETMDWNQPLIQELGFNPSLFMPITQSGSNLGPVKEEIAKELGIQPFDVISVTSHDTALALQGLPMEEDYLFIATGTWVIVGAKQEKMTMNEKVMEYGLTNEGGRYPSVNLLKNHVGLWILQESKRYWENNGVNIGFGEMVEVAREASINSIINIYDPRFFEPGDMPTKVQDYCKETKQEVPNTIGEIVRVIEESLAKQIAKTLSELEEAVEKRYDRVCMFGGGVQDQLLCQLIEKYSKKKLIFASKEATALGNITEQFIALGTMKEEERIKVLEASM
jgi:sugar (pentulose or hexulose) kinase